MNLGVHAYAWTSEWNDSQLGLIERCGKLGLELIEIPLMRLNLCNPEAIRHECERVGIGIIPLKQIIHVYCSLAIGTFVSKGMFEISQDYVDLNRSCLKWGLIYYQLKDRLR